MKNKWYILAIIAAVIVGLALLANCNKEPAPMAYSTAIDLGGNDKVKAARYYVQLEYKAPQTKVIQYDTLPGIPSPHPATVQVNETFFHQGLYVWKGKPTEDFYGSIIEKLDSTGTLYRVVSVKLL